MVDCAVDVLWDEKAEVFVGTSEDIPGLTLEADRLGELLDAAFDMVPSLIEQNLTLPEGTEVPVTFRVRQPLRQSAPPTPRYMVETIGAYITCRMDGSRWPPTRMTSSAVCGRRGSAGSARRAHAAGAASG